MTTVDEIQNEARERLRSANQVLAQAENEMREAVNQGLDARLTIAEVARLAGVSRPTIYDWTRGRTAGQR